MRKKKEERGGGGESERSEDLRVSERHDKDGDVVDGAAQIGVFPRH